MIDWAASFSTSSLGCGSSVRFFATSPGITNTVRRISSVSSSGTRCSHAHSSAHIFLVSRSGIHIEQCHPLQMRGELLEDELLLVPIERVRLSLPVRRIGIDPWLLREPGEVRPLVSPFCCAVVQHARGDSNVTVQGPI